MLSFEEKKRKVKVGFSYTAACFYPPFETFFSGSAVPLKFDRLTCRTSSKTFCLSEKQSFLGENNPKTSTDHFNMLSESPQLQRMKKGHDVHCKAGDVRETAGSKGPMLSMQHNVKPQMPRQ